MGSSPRAVSNQRKGSRFPARPLNQPRGSEPGTSSFRGGLFAHCATWTPCNYAAEHIPAGSIIATYRGEVISEARRAAREATLGFGSQTYAMQYKEPGSMEPLYIVDARSTGSIGRFINHACGDSANCALEALQYQHRRVMAFRASRDIAKDEPIRFNYFGADSNVSGTSDSRCRARILDHWRGCCCGDPRCLQPSAAAPFPIMPTAPILAPAPMPNTLRTLAPGSSIFSDGPFDLRLSEHRLLRRGSLQVGLRAFSDGLPLSSVHL